MAYRVLLLPRDLPRRAGVGEVDVGEVFDEGHVELAEAGQLRADDIRHLRRVFARAQAGDVQHAGIAHVGQSRYALVQLAFREGFWQHEQRYAEGGEQIDLVRETDAGVVAEDFDGFLQAAGEVEGLPVAEVGGEGVEIHDAVFDHHAVEGDVGVEVHARAEVILDAGDGGGGVGEEA